MAQEGKESISAHLQTPSPKLTSDQEVELTGATPGQHLPLLINEGFYPLLPAGFEGIVLGLLIDILAAISKSRGYASDPGLCSPCCPSEAFCDRGKYFFLMSVLSRSSAISIARFKISFSSSRRLILASSWEI